MRHVWVGFLVTGLLLVGLNAYDRRQARDRGLADDATVFAGEDGSPLPEPYPTPTPQPK
jgi:hypothetical protein